MIDLLKEWPPVLLRRWLLTIAAAFGFLLVGIAAWAAAQDRILLALSGAMFLFSLARAALLFRCLLRKDYAVLEGVCIQVTQFPIQKCRKVRLLDAGEQEFTLMLGKQQRTQIGCWYRFYLRRTADVPIPGGWFAASLTAGNLLGMELVDEKKEHS